jgi:hypothetical protein
LSGGAPASCKSPTDDTTRGVFARARRVRWQCKGERCRVQSCRRCKWRNGQETRCGAPYPTLRRYWTHASGGLPRRFAEPFRQRGPLPCGSVPTACSHWGAIGLSGGIGGARWAWDRRAECARRKRRLGALLKGGCRVGEVRSTSGRAKRVSRRGRSPQEAVVDGYAPHGVVHNGKVQFHLISISGRITVRQINGLEGEIPRKRAVRA